MSPYIVDKITIDRIMSYLINADSHAEYYIKPYPKTDKELEEFGQKLYDLNASAVNQRYNEKSPAPIYKLGYDTVDIFQTLKSLQCLIYQCSEGDAPAQALYEQLRELERAIALKIINEMPQYKKAQWG
jgi:hypothetical protein